MKNVLAKCFALSTDHPDHLMLFRTFVSRKSAGKGRAVLEGVGLDSETIEACFNSWNEEEAVQAGLIKWRDGLGNKLPTWRVLFAAMEYAQIAQQHVHDLKKESSYPGTCVCVRVCVCVCVCVRAVQVSTSCTYVQWISKCVECNAIDSASNKLAMAILFVKAAIAFACMGLRNKINKCGCWRAVNLPLILPQFQVHPRHWKTAFSSSVSCKSTIHMIVY